jgi:hypothetical protein
MGNLKVIARLVSCVCVMLSAAPLSPAKEWRGIVPLHATRANVERRFGKPRAGSNMYEFKTERAYVVYSDGSGCAKESESEWNVPRDTVLSIIVTPKVTMRFSALNIDLKRYKKDKDPEVPTHVYYKDKEAGRTYEVFEGGGKDDGLILHIEYGPSAKDSRRRCNRPA